MRYADLVDLVTRSGRAQRALPKESERTALIRGQNALIAEQNRILSGSASTGERTCSACGKPMMASSVKFVNGGRILALAHFP
jgi:hypothetical protein